MVVINTADGKATDGRQGRDTGGFMKIALAAVGFRNGDTVYNKEQIKKVIRGNREKSDLILFGETFLQGFDSLSWDYDTDREIAVSVDDPVIDEIREAAKSGSVAVSFGYIEKAEDSIFSSQLTIGKNGEIIDNFRRVSSGWKEPVADLHYKEGDGFRTFSFEDKEFAVGLCGDMWDDENVRQMKDLNADVVLWPVYTDFNYEEWNNTIKDEYAEQAGLFGHNVMYVNSVCLGREGQEIARGGAAYFLDGKIEYQTPAGKESILYIML